MVVALQWLKRPLKIEFKIGVEAIIASTFQAGACSTSFHHSFINQGKNRSLCLKSTCKALNYTEVKKNTWDVCRDAFLRKFDVEESSSQKAEHPLSALRAPSLDSNLPPAVVAFYFVLSSIHARSDDQWRSDKNRKRNIGPKSAKKINGQIGEVLEGKTRICKGK